MLDGLQDMGKETVICTTVFGLVCFVSSLPHAELMHGSLQNLRLTGTLLVSKIAQES